MRHFMFVVLACVSTWAAAFTPQSGAWKIDSEYVPGQPGRGFQLEVQGQYLAVSFYGYDVFGNPAYYIAAGTLKGNNFSAELNQYAGGHGFGEAPVPAVSTGSAGLISITFDTGLTGTMTLPSTAPLSVSRMDYGFPTGYEGLRGEWTFVYDMGPIYADRFFLDTHVVYEGFDLMVSADERVACERGTPPDQDLVACARLNPDDSITPFLFEYFADAGEGVRFSDNSYDVYYALRAWRTASATGRNTGILGGVPAASASADASAYAAEKAADDGIAASSPVEATLSAEQAGRLTRVLRGR